MYLFVLLELPKEMDLPPAPDCDKWGLINLNQYVINNMNSDLLQEIIHTDICHSFRSMYMELFEHIDMRKQIYHSRLEII